MGRMMKILDTRACDFSREFAQILERGKMDMGEVSPIVQNILDEIKNEGVEALCRHISRFDKWEAKTLQDLKISQEQCFEAYKKLPDDLKKALHLAYDKSMHFIKNKNNKLGLIVKKMAQFLALKSPLWNALGYIFRVAKPPILAHF